jgi:hypothetical protein
MIRVPAPMQSPAAAAASASGSVIGSVDRRK